MVRFYIQLDWLSENVALSGLFLDGAQFPFPKWMGELYPDSWAKEVRPGVTGGFFLLNTF